MSRIPCAWLLAACIGLCVGAGPMASRCIAEGPTRAEQEIAKLIEQLGSDSFQVREEATQQLMEREDAAAAVRQALKSPDLEVARRAAVILKAFAYKEKMRGPFGMLSAHAKSGEVDRTVELFARRPTSDDEDECWQLMVGIAHKLIDLEKHHFGDAVWSDPTRPAAAEGYPISDFRRYAAAQRPKFLVAPQGVLGNLDLGSETPVVARGEDITAKFPHARSLLIAAGNVRLPTVYGCVIFAGASVEVEALDWNFVVCDGDFTASQRVRGSLVIARGAVRLPPNTTASQILTSDVVHMPKEVTSNKKDAKVVVKEHDLNPLGFVKFFDPASVGVTVEAAEGGVRVKEAADGKAFAKAGLRAGDLAVAADGAEVRSPDDFRRLLRKKLATGEELTLEVRRDGKPVKLVVPVKD